MSMITRCPSCATLFKVVPDQLRISGGWVRCGHCADVFDARAHLQPTGTTPEERKATSATGVVQPAHPRPTPMPVHVPTQEPASSPAPLPTRSPAQPPVAAEPGPAGSSEAFVRALPPLAPARAKPDSVAVVGPEMSGVQPSASPAIKPTPVPKASESRRAHERRPATEADEDDEDEFDNQDITFVRDARRKAFWRRTPVRVLLSLTALILWVLLSLQAAVHERDRLAAMEPSLKPLLQALCEPLHCVVASPRLVEAVVIDSSSFTKVRSDVYRLGLSIRNTAGLPVAAPALELTLTDGQDQAVLRRVFAPEHVGWSPTLPAGADAAAVLNLGVDGAQAARVAGYRLLAFYP